MYWNTIGIKYVIIGARLSFILLIYVKCRSKIELIVNLTFYHTILMKNIPTIHFHRCCLHLKSNFLINNRIFIFIWKVTKMKTHRKTKRLLNDLKENTKYKH